jgi:hypothetical protein
MLYREIIAVRSEIHTKHINTLSGQNVGFVSLKPCGTNSNHWALEGQQRKLSTTNNYNIQCFRPNLNRPF